MAKVMETNLSHAVLLKHYGEMLGNVIGNDPLSQFIDIDIVCILFAVGVSTEFAVLSLLGLQLV